MGAHVIIVWIIDWLPVSRSATAWRVGYLYKNHRSARKPFFPTGDIEADQDFPK